MRHAGSIVLCACVLPAVVWSAARWDHARKESRVAYADLESTRNARNELYAILARAPSSATEPASGVNLSSQFPLLLQRAGIPAGVLSSLQPSQESALPTPAAGINAVSRQVRVSLSGLTLVQLGDVLQGLSTLDADWKPVALTVTPIPGARSQAGTDQPLAVEMTLESVVLAPRYSATGAAR